MRAFDGHHLASSPLCLSVPLEGTDKVEGLHVIERDAVNHKDEERVSQHFISPRADKGGLVQDLTVEDVKAEPRPWVEFAGWGAASVDEAYNVPVDLSALSFRIEVCTRFMEGCRVASVVSNGEACMNIRVQVNIVRWLPNYVRVALAILLATFYLRPIALPGAAVLLFSVVRAVQAAVVSGTAPERSDAGMVESVVPQQRGAYDRSQVLTIVLGVGTWLAVSHTGCLPILTLGITLAATSVLMHAGLRRPVMVREGASSGGLAARMGPLFRRPNNLVSSGGLAQGAEGGWSFKQVLGVSAVPEGAQPRLVLRQGTLKVWHGCHGVVTRCWRSAGLRARHWWSARRLEG